MKTICIYHSVDLDGWMSAAIVIKWFQKEYSNICMEDLNKGEAFGPVVHGENPNELHLFGWNYNDEIPDLSGYDKVVMCDVSFPKAEMAKMAACQIANGLTWIDHHISAINDNNFSTTVKDLDKVVVNGLRDTKFAACELTWKYFFPEDPMPEIVRLLGRYDCFGHAGTDEEQKVLEFQYGARSCINSYQQAYDYLTKHVEGEKGAMLAHHISVQGIHDVGRAIYSYLCTEAKQIYAKGFPVEFKLKILPEEYQLEYKIVSFLCINRERFNPVNFGINYHAEGYDGIACFWYQKGNWHFSLYNDNGKVDCSAIAKSYGGGGHKGAAGFIVSDLGRVITIL